MFNLDNLVAKTCKVSSVILFILSFIGGIILAKDEFGDFLFSSFLYIIIGAFFFCLILFAVGEIIAQLEISNATTYAIYEKGLELKKGKMLEGSQTSPTVSKVEDGWICNKCKMKNATGSMVCKDCGQYR